MKIILTVLNLVFLAGTVLLLIFTVLAGSSKHAPLNKFYWLSADTSNILGAFTESAWTFWGVCQKDDYSNCKLGPAYPLSPVDNFGTEENVPQKFIDSRDTFYYLSRFSFAFTLVALAFTGLAFIINILGFCIQIVDKIVIALVSFGLFFLAGFAAFQTAIVVLARNAFQDAGLSALIGVKALAITWAAVATLLIVWVNTFSSNIVLSYKKHMATVRANEPRYYEDPATAPVAGPVAAGPAGDESSFTRTTPAAAKEEDNGGIRFFKIKRNHKVSDEESV